MTPVYPIPLFSPVLVHRAVNNLVRGRVTGRTTDGRYDVLLSDGVSVAGNLDAGQFTVTGEAIVPADIIPWEGSKAA